jgi:MFS family permease
MTSTSANINRWRAFALLAVSFFMTIIDLTIVNVSLPTIGRDLHFSATSLQWVVTAYALTFGGSCSSAAVRRTCSAAAGS